MRTPLLTLSLFLGAGLACSLAQYHNISSVHDGSGRMSTNTVAIEGHNYTNISAAGQPGGIAISSNAAGTLYNYAGFLQAVDIKRPLQDTDGDGAIDEVDLDNDGDGLADSDEVDGGQFNPDTPTLVNVADSDGDGVNDGNEQVAGTDPTNELAFLQIIAFSNAPSGKEIRWLARSGKTYHVRKADDSHIYPADVLSTNTETPGFGDWEVRTNTYTDTSGTDVRTYGVEVLP